MKIHFTAILVLFLIPLNLSAQFDERDPGIYAVVDGKMNKLEYSDCLLSIKDGSYKGKVDMFFEGHTSGTPASDSLIIVIDPKKHSYTANRPFFMYLTPNYMKIVPVIPLPDIDCRGYSPGSDFYVGSLDIIQQREGLDFEWEYLTDNSFAIKVLHIQPGEYGVYFRSSVSSTFSLYGIFGFTVPESYHPDIQTEQFIDLSDPSANETALN